MTDMTDREKVQFLRGWLDIGHTDGTPFEAAAVKLYFREQGYGYVGMPEIQSLVTYFAKLPTMIELGYVVTPTDNFTYWMLKDNGVIDAFGYLTDEINGPANPVVTP